MADIVAVAVSAAVGDSVGVALKAGSAAGSIIPVVFFGVMKMTYYTSQTQSIAMSAPAKFVCSTQSGADVGVCQGASTGYVAYNGASYILGLLLQIPAASLDTVLVLVGRSA